MREDGWNGQYYFIEVVSEAMTFRLEPEWQESQQCKNVEEEANGRRNNKCESSDTGRSVACKPKKKADVDLAEHEWKRVERCGQRETEELDPTGSWRLNKEFGFYS